MVLWPINSLIDLTDLGFYSIFILGAMLKGQAFVTVVSVFNVEAAYSILWVSIRFCPLSPKAIEDTWDRLTGPESESEVAQSCVTLWPLGPPGPSVHGIFQARILEWVAIFFSRRSSWPRDWTCVLRFLLGRQILYYCTIWGALLYSRGIITSFMLCSC